MSYRSEILARGDTKGYIELDETTGTNAVDDAGAGADGTYTGGYTLNETPGPLADEAGGWVLLNGTSGYITFADHADRDLGDGPFTIMGRFQRSAAGGTTEQILVDKGPGAYVIVLNAAGVSNKIGFGKSGTAIIVNANIDIDDTLMHTVAWKKNGTANKVFIDGVDRTGTVTNQTLVNTATQLLLGRLQNSNILYFPGRMGRWSFHNAEVSDADILAYHVLATTSPSVAPAAAALGLAAPAPTVAFTAASVAPAAAALGLAAPAPAVTGADIAGAVRLTSGGATSAGASSFTTASITPTPNRLLLLAVHQRSSTTPIPPNSVLGCGLTWVHIATVEHDLTGQRGMLTLWRAMGPSPTTGAVTIGWGDSNQVGALWAIDELSGLQSGGTHGSAAIVQTATGVSTEDGPPSMLATLAALADPANPTFGAFAANLGSSVAPGAGFTELSDDTITVLVAHVLQTQWKATGDTTVDATNSDPAKWSAIAVELALLRVSLAPAAAPLGLAAPAPIVAVQAVFPVVAALGLAAPAPSAVLQAVAPPVAALGVAAPAPFIDLQLIVITTADLGPADPRPPTAALILGSLSPTLAGPAPVVIVVPAPTFDEVIRGPHQRIAQVSLLNADLSVAQTFTGSDGTVIDGSVSTDADRRRSCQLMISNQDGIRTPATPADPFFLNRLIRIERGIILNGSPLLFALGVFLIDRPVVSVTGAGATLRVSGQDRVKLALKSQFTKPTRYAAGRRVADVVRAIAQDAGMGATLYRLDDGDKSLLADRIFDTGIDRWPAIRALAADFALDVYVDRDGYLVLEPAMTADTLPEPVWTFERGADAIMLGITKELDDERWRNHTLVASEASDLHPVSAEARDLNPASPGYNPPDGTGPIGDRLDVFTSAGIRSVEQAQAVADARLLQFALIEESITIPSVVHPGLRVGDVIAVVEAQSRTDDRYLIDTLTVPLAAGPMTMTARRVRSLAA